MSGESVVLTPAQQEVFDKCLPCGISTAVAVRAKTGCGEHTAKAVAAALCAKLGRRSYLEIWREKCATLDKALGNRDPFTVRSKEIADICGMRVRPVETYMARKRKEWRAKHNPTQADTSSPDYLLASLTKRQREVFDKCLEAGIYTANAIAAFVGTGNDTASVVAKALRAHSRRATRMEQWKAKCAEFDKVLGDRDPCTITNAAFAAEAKATIGNVARYMKRRRDAIRGEVDAVHAVITAVDSRSHEERADFLAEVLGSRDPRDVSLVSFAAEAKMSPHLVERWLSTEKRRMAIVDPDGKRRAPKPVPKIKYNDGCDLPPPIRAPRGRRVKLVVDGDHFEFVEKVNG